MSDLITTKEAAEMIGCPEGSLRHHCKKHGVGYAEKDGRRLLYRRADVERMAAERRDDRTPATLTAEEQVQAVIYQAWREGRIGPSSPFYREDPPESYRLAWEKREGIVREEVAA